jgi:hypothetical protein
VPGTKCGHDTTALRMRESFEGGIGEKGETGEILRRRWGAGLAGILGVMVLSGCASSPTPENPRAEEVRHEEPRRDEGRAEESRRRESKSERRRRKDERAASGSSSAEGSTQAPPPGSAAQTSSSGASHDLSGDEKQGGHTLSRHVGRSDADLQERLERERNISAASTYTDRAMAEAVVGGVLEQNAEVQRWEERGARRPNLALDYHGDASRPIGRCMQRGSNVAAPAWDAIVVLKASRDGGFYVLTSYPECPR